jgi:hypothetical protein
MREAGQAARVIGLNAVPWEHVFISRSTTDSLSVFNGLTLKSWSCTMMGVCNL